MQLAVLGATGKTGRPLVAQALARGWRVRALVRDAARAPPGVEAIVGDATDPTAIARVVQGADAIVDLLGHGKGTPDDMRERAARAVVAAAREASVRRVLFLTGGGVRAEGDRPKPIDRLARAGLRLLRPRMLEDGTRARDVVVATELDWTIVRAGRMLEKPGTGKARAGAVGSVGAMVPHEDVARFILDAIEKGTYVRAQPMVGP